MNEELKVRSFRADNDTFEKFKQLAEGEFGNQGQCLSALINLYETENSKAILVNRGLEIESFQDYLNKISSLFLTSLQLNQDAEGRIREEFARQLESKGLTIIDLQSKINELVNKREEFEELSKSLKGENTELKATVSELKSISDKQKQDFTSILTDKDSLNKALADSSNERKEEIEVLRTARADATEQLKKLESIETENKSLKIGLESSKNEIEVLKIAKADATEQLKKLESIETENKSLKIGLESLKNEIERQKELAEISKDKALTMLEKEHQQENKKLNDHYNSKIQGFLEKIEKLQERKETSETNIEEKKEEKPSKEVKKIK